jgi:hypothetical protein
VYFWGIHNQIELELLILKHCKKFGFEFKMSDVHKMTTSMNKVPEELKLHSLTFIYLGARVYQMADNVVAFPISLINNFKWV